MERIPEILTPKSQLCTPTYVFYGIIPYGPDGNLEIYDGDTVTLALDLGLEQWIAPVHYRLFGLQAPEIRPLHTREIGTAARDHLRSLVRHYHVWEQDQEFPGPGLGLIVRTHKKQRSKKDYRPREVREKYGRWLVELVGQDENGLVNLNDLMLKDKYAEAYLP